METKNCMLDYMTEIMEDAKDFGWASAKAAHALLLCCMEEGKVDWHMTEKLIVSEGHMPKKWLQLHPPRLRKYIVLCKVPHVNFFRWVSELTNVQL